jgi:allantoinase
LLLSEGDLDRVGAAAKCSPPLRDDNLRAVLADSVSLGHLHFVASDHSPSPPEMKSDVDAFRIWGGVAGIQSTLPALLTLGFAPELVTRLTSAHASTRFQIENKGALRVGHDADVAMVDVSSVYVLRREDLLDRHKLSPYVGRTFRGKVVRTILRGHTIFADGKTVGPPIGRFVRPGRAGSAQ